MLYIVFKRAVEEYFSNFKVMLSFGVLFIFLALFVWFEQFFFSSGSVFLSFNTGLLGLVTGAIGLVIVLIFLYVFSFFISLTVYSVHRDVQTVSFDTYWNDLFKVAALKIFFLYLLLAIIFFLVSAGGVFFNLVPFALFINFIIGLLFFFAPQSIVLDGAGVREALGNSIDFWGGHFVVGLAIFIVATVCLFVVLGIEYWIDSMGAPGLIVSFILVLMVLVPFIEQAKSFAYLMKVDLLKGNEFVHARAPKASHPKLAYGTRLREQPRSGSKI